MSVDKTPHGRHHTPQLWFSRWSCENGRLFDEWAFEHLPTKMKPVKITIVMTAAAAVLVLGLLMAPEKGIELKKKIREGVHDWYDEFSRLLYTDL